MTKSNKDKVIDGLIKLLDDRQIIYRSRNKERRALAAEILGDFGVDAKKALRKLKKLKSHLGTHLRDYNSLTLKAVNSAIDKIEDKTSALPN